MRGTSVRDADSVMSLMRDLNLMMVFMGVWDDCELHLILLENELITEASNSNVFFVRGDTVLTPSQVAANLKGTTKASVFRLCKAAGIEIREAELGLEDLFAAEECFLTSANREIMPVCAVRCSDSREREFPRGGGPLTQRLAAAYKDFVASYVAEHRDYSMFG